MGGKLHYSHKYLCGKDSSSFFVPPLSEAEALKLDEYREIPWSHECRSCSCPKAALPGLTLFEVVQALGSFKGDWETATFVVSHSRPFSTLNRETERTFPLSSIGIKSFDMMAQQMSPLITLAENSDSSQNSNPFILYNELFRLSLVHNTIIVIVERASGRGEPVLSHDVVRASYERFVAGIKGFDTSGFNPRMREWLQAMVKRYLRIMRSLGFSK
ncbi:uncharacterized protein JCM6883_004553 [Sporobolomyces salmoneus]|uniref:uncharacterized protein n=1 Tax=Sporobolomyces salmoneus TaxID=183962 RepID=UPI00317EE715